MAVTANQVTKRQGAKRKRSYPVAASTTIYDQTLVFINAAGYAVGITNTGVNGFAGVADGFVDNSSGSAGDKWVEVWVDGDWELTGTGFAQTDVHMPCYADDNYACVVALGATSVRIGKVVKYVSSTKHVVAIQPSNVGALEVAALTTITPASAPGTPDYAIADPTNSNAYGFTTADEFKSVMAVVANLQARVLDLEARVK